MWFLDSVDVDGVQKALRTQRVVQGTEDTLLGDGHRVVVDKVVVVGSKLMWDMTGFEVVVGTVLEVVGDIVLEVVGDIVPGRVGGMVPGVVRGNMVIVQRLVEGMVVAVEIELAVAFLGNKVVEAQLYGSKRNMSSSADVTLVPAVFCRGEKTSGISGMESHFHAVDSCQICHLSNYTINQSRCYHKFLQSGTRVRF